MPRPCHEQHPSPAATQATCRVCHLYQTRPDYRVLWDGQPSTPATTLALVPRNAGGGLTPCRHLGGDTGDRVKCPTCRGSVELKTFFCELHGRCTQGKAAKGVSCCDTCPDHSPDTFRLVAPLGTSDQGARWEGRLRKRPWHFKVTCVLPHLNTPDLLGPCLDLLRLQTERPYIILVDTGSPFDVCDRLETMRSDDLEVHYLRGNGYTHSSEPVSAALDAGFGRVNTGLIFLTHVDCFMMRRDVISWLAGQCSAACPVVGWQMSDRSWATELWKGMVSHTCTMLHAATVRGCGATWHMQRGRDMLGLGLNFQANGWPDTECAFNLALQEAGVPVKLLGPESNYRRQVGKADGDQRAWWDHARSTTGLRAYDPGSSLHKQAENYAARAVAEAKERAARWRRGED